MTTAQRGYGGRWQRLRLRHLGKNPCCEMCKAEGRYVPATVVDHVKPHRGDEALQYDESNLQSLCATHHSSHKQREEISDKYFSAGSGK